MPWSRSVAINIARRALRKTVNLGVTNAVHLLQECKQTLEAAKIARDLDRKDPQAEERKYQLGSTTVFFVLDAQTQLAQAELALGAGAERLPNRRGQHRSCHRQAPRAAPSETRATSQLRVILREA
jgi:hypothetical protein